MAVIKYNEMNITMKTHFKIRINYIFLKLLTETIEYLY